MEKHQGWSAWTLADVDRAANIKPETQDHDTWICISLMEGISLTHYVDVFDKTFLILVHFLNILNKTF